MAAGQASFPSPDTPGRASSSWSRDREAVRQYYIAVDRIQFKMGTLVELLEVLGRRDGLPMAICCSSRDSLATVWAALAASNQFFLSALHSDVDESDRATSLETFRLAISDWNYFNMKRLSGERTEAELIPGKSQVLVMTDACLPMHALGETPLLARVMVNYDIPSKKEAYFRRMAACLGPSVTGTPGASVVTGTRSSAGGISKSDRVRGKIAITMVVAGEVGVLRTLEESCGIVLDEMPINVSELV